MSPTLRAYLELARLSNAPTVVSNALLGSALGGLASGATLADAGWAAIAAPAAACTMLYVSGMALNDLADRAIDARERPKRPIPSGRATPRGAAAFASVLVVAALGLLSLTTVPSLVAGIVLLVLIVLYDLTHARTAATVALMGACRGMVYVVAALAIAPLAAPTRCSSDWRPAPISPSARASIRGSSSPSRSTPSASARARGSTCSCSTS